MAITTSVTLADPALPPDILAEIERLNNKAAKHHIWLRTRANAAQKAPWHEGAAESMVQTPKIAKHAENPPPVFRPTPHLWRWADIEPYLHQIAEIAPLEFTDRQQFLLINPAMGGKLQVTNTMRVAVSIYKPGDTAITHRHTPNASRTILSNVGGYTTVQGEYCVAKRGDLILTPNGTWHGHGNDSSDPVIWMDVLDWPLLETLDCIWIEEEDAARANNDRSRSPDFSNRHFGSGGMVPNFGPETGGLGNGNSPLFHYKGQDIQAKLMGLIEEDGDPYEGVRLDFTNPLDGGAVFTTLSYGAQILRPGEMTLAKRETASTLYCVMDGSGATDVAGETFEWHKNDIFVIPGHLWRQHINKDNDTPAVLYTVSDASLLQKVGHYHAQGRTITGNLVELH